MVNYHAVINTVWWLVPPPNNDTCQHS